MPAHCARAAPTPEPDSPIAPHQLWGYLSTSQQQHVRKVLIGVAQQLLSHLPSQPQAEERTDEPRSRSESGENHHAAPRT